MLGIVEKLSGAANLISMERDWIVTVAAPDGHMYDLTHLNSVMRRIDLICKLVAPILMSAIISALGLRFGICTVASMDVVSWGFEVLSAKHVWNQNSALQVPKTLEDREITNDGESLDRALPITQANSSHTEQLVANIQHVLRVFKQDVRRFFNTDVWIPSLALSMLHISVLNYNASFISYLLSTGLSLNIITIARASGGIIEISSTVIAPVGINYLGKHGYRHRHETESNEAEDALLEQAPESASETESNIDIGLERLGLWGITWQFLNLVNRSDLITPTCADNYIRLPQYSPYGVSHQILSFPTSHLSCPAY